MSVKTRKIMNHCAVWHKINANHKRTKNRAALHDLCYPYGWQAIPMGGRPYLREIKAFMERHFRTSQE